jgi:hypothetical protein
VPQESPAKGYDGLNLPLGEHAPAIATTMWLMGLAVSTSPPRDIRVVPARRAASVVALSLVPCHQKRTSR